MRTLGSLDAVARWTLTHPRAKLVTIGGNSVRHGRSVTVRMAEIVVPRELYADHPRRIDRLGQKPVPAWPTGCSRGAETTGSVVP
jgi:hypothetical protein